jgi:hypothetical protein
LYLGIVVVPGFLLVASTPSKSWMLEVLMELILIILVLVLLFGGGGYYGRRMGHW